MAYTAIIFNIYVKSAHDDEEELEYNILAIAPSKKNAVALALELMDKEAEDIDELNTADIYANVMGENLTKENLEPMINYALANQHTVLTEAIDQPRTLDESKFVHENFSLLINATNENFVSEKRNKNLSEIMTNL